MVSALARRVGGISELWSPAGKSKYKFFRHVTFSEATALNKIEMQLLQWYTLALK